MKSIKHARNGSCVEAVERRVMMDGSVSAAIQSGDLVVRGDSADNQIVISRSAGGTIHITGREQTTVNGKSSVDLPQFPKSLVIDAQQGGDDLVSVQGAFNIPGDLRARIGAGELLVEGSAGRVSIGGDLNVQSSDEGHVTVRNEVAVKGKTSIDAGGDVNVVAGLATAPAFAAARFDHGLNINNPYFPVVPGTVLTYKSKDVDDETGEVTFQTNVVKVLSKTATLAGVKVRTVSDQVFTDGLLTEDTIDFYAQDNNGNVWYFGEDTTTLEYDDQGHLISTASEGSWRAGLDGAQAGTIMEANPRVGHRYFQEFAPGNVMDQGKGLATNATATVPAGTFHQAYRTLEESVIEPLVLENKFYAPGIGVVLERDLDAEDDEIIGANSLVSVTLNGKPVTQLVPADRLNGINATGRAVGGATLGGGARIQAKGPVVLNGARAGDTLTIGSGAQIIVADSNLSGDASLTTSDTLSLKDLFAKQTIVAGGDPDDLYLFNAHIHNFQGTFGPANNSLFVKRSVIDTLAADGGPGHNTFNDQGNNVFGKLSLKRFTRV